MPLRELIAGNNAARDDVQQTDFGYDVVPRYICNNRQEIKYEPRRRAPIPSTEPAPWPKAIGIAPNSAANVVIMIGRKRGRHAYRAK